MIRLAKFGIYCKYTFKPNQNIPKLNLYRLLQFKNS